MIFDTATRLFSLLLLFVPTVKGCREDTEKAAFFVHGEARLPQSADACFNSCALGNCTGVLFTGDKCVTIDKTNYFGRLDEKNYIEKHCVKKSPHKLLVSEWNDRVLIDRSRSVRKAASKLECLSLCAQEKSFPCLSAMFYQESDDCLLNAASSSSAQVKLDTGGFKVAYMELHGLKRKWLFVFLLDLPMFYCETCQQSLCHSCRTSTHQARMFASHKIISSDERSKVYGSALCKDHNEPYILYCSDVRKLVCIQCFNGRPLEERHSFISIEQGHRMCLEKIEQSAAKLRFYQSERQEELNVRQRILDENASNFSFAKTELFQLCQQIIDTVMTTRETLAKELMKQQEQSDEQCKRQIKEIEAVMSPVRLCLFSSQILCNTASKLDVVQLCPQLQKRISSILDKTVDKLPVSSTPDSLEVRSDLAKSLEPYLGMSAAWCPISVSREGSSSNSYKRGSGSHKTMPMLSKFQAAIDLAGAFGQLFGKVEHPLRQLVVELASISQQVLETQRDLTIRRCLIEKEDVEKLVKMCKKIEASLGMHSAALDGMQSEMQEIWQEQLDRVRRQQIIYRDKVQEVLNLRETARQVLTAAKQLVPYVSCILNMNAMIDPKRCHPPDPAPMESICLEITGIEPNSQNRILAIEKEEENRRLIQEAKKKEELAGQCAVMKSLKHGKIKRKEVQHRMMTSLFCR
uniref:B box-type domain-containing protein n=1 Tax=Caenorhabditis japonica TaxID=281687 RepID=A0A8R1E6J2_CAEJA